MKAILDRWVRAPFQRAQVELDWFGPVVSAVVVALLINVLTEALTTWAGVWWALAAVGALTLAVVGFVFVYAAVGTWRNRRPIASLIDRIDPPKSRGLVFLYTREETLRKAIDYHRPVLAYVWLLATPERHVEAAQVVSGLPEGVSGSLVPLKDLYDSQDCYRAVTHIYRHEVPRLGLSPKEVIADITGGTKPMTMGMVAACLEGNYPVEHVPAEYDSTKRVSRTLPPIEIVVQRRAGERG